MSTPGCTPRRQEQRFSLFFEIPPDWRRNVVPSCGGNAFLPILKLNHSAAIVAIHIASAALGQGNGWMPCRYEVANTIQGPICGATGSPSSTKGTGISRNGKYVCGYYLCVINTSAFVYKTETHQF